VWDAIGSGRLCDPRRGYAETFGYLVGCQQPSVLLQMFLPNDDEHPFERPRYPSDRCPTMSNLMTDTTMIYLAGGHAVTVTEQPSQVADVLTRPEPFHRLTTLEGAEIYVASDQVSYFERIPGHSVEPLVALR
jgi:hypothetical protein